MKEENGNGPDASIHKNQKAADLDEAESLDTDLVSEGRKIWLIGWNNLIGWSRKPRGLGVGCVNFMDLSNKAVARSVKMLCLHKQQAMGLGC